MWGRQRPCKCYLQGQPSRAFWRCCLCGVCSIGRLAVPDISMLCLAPCPGYLCLHGHALLHTHTRTHARTHARTHQTSILKPACSCIPFPVSKVAGVCCTQLQPKLCMQRQLESCVKQVFVGRAHQALFDRLPCMQGECRTLLDGSLLAGNFAVNGGAIFAGTMPCFMVCLVLPTAAITFCMTVFTRTRLCCSHFLDAAHCGHHFA